MATTTQDLHTRSVRENPKEKHGYILTVTRNLMTGTDEDGNILYTQDTYTNEYRVAPKEPHGDFFFYPVHFIVGEPIYFSSLEEMICPEGPHAVRKV